jgi:tetratricopeptide (TPR) repeat protein
MACELWARWEYGRGETANSHHDFARAREHFERALNVWFWSSRTHLAAARAARRAGDFSGSLIHLRSAQNIGGHDDAVDVELKLMRLQQGDVRSVAPELETLLAQNHPDSVAILEVLTPAYIQGYQLESALQCIGRWLEREPNRLEPWQYRAQVYGRMQSSAELLASYRHILELDRDDDECRLRLAAELVAARQFDEALKEYEHLRARQGGGPAVLTGMASCLAALNRPDEARRLLDEVLSVNPHSAGALAERGRLALQYESPARAESWLRQAVAENPSEHEVLYSLFQCLERMGQKAEAAEVQARIKRVESDLLELREAMRQVAMAPHDPEPRRQAGLVLLRNGKKDEGLRWLTSALIENPHHKATHATLADYYDKAGDVARAAQHRKLAS